MPAEEDFSYAEPFLTSWLEGEDEVIYRNGHDLYEAEQQEACLYSSIENVISQMPCKTTHEEVMAKIRDFFFSPLYFLEADDSALTQFGLLERDAFLFSQVPSIARAIGYESFEKHPRLNTYIKMSEYLKTLFIGRHEECFYTMLLDRYGCLIRPALIETGTIDTTQFNMGDVISIAMFHSAKAVVFCHNHPRGTLKPSDDDVACTLYALSALKSVNVPLLDHIIIADANAFSFRDHDVIPFRLWVDQAPRCKLIREWMNHEVFDTDGANGN